MADDTSIGGTRGEFPVTRWSAVLAARSDNPDERRRAFDTLIAAYWKPVYKYIRMRWGKSNEDAKDATQEFFARVMEKDFLAGYDPAKARLRTFLRVCVDGFVANLDKAARRIKRGGEAQILSLDFETAEGELRQMDPPAPDRVDDFFEKEFVRSLFTMAVEQRRAECEARGKQTHFLLFEQYDLDDAGERPLTYEELARQHGIAVTDVTNYLAYARREFRRIALEKLAAMCGSEEEFRREARSILGMDKE